jgi:hypothetical protein
VGGQSLTFTTVTGVGAAAGTVDLALSAKTRTARKRQNGLRSRA